MPKGARRRPERLAEKLCHIRRRLELTQEELKERLEQFGFVSDLDRADVSDFERGVLLAKGQKSTISINIH